MAIGWRTATLALHGHSTLPAAPDKERFLTLDETRRLGAALAAQEAVSPLPPAVVRLLLLTGCRQSEIRTLHWQDYREGHLFLRDGKAGPRTVWLSSTARLVLDCLPRTGHWVFPASTGHQRMSTETLYGCWRTLRAAAGVSDVRLHDLRHSYASFALRQGETVPTISRLLGHRDPATTLKYTHFADATVREAVEACRGTSNVKIVAVRSVRGYQPILRWKQNGSTNSTRRCKSRRGARGISMTVSSLSTTRHANTSGVR